MSAKEIKQKNDEGWGKEKIIMKDMEKVTAIRGAMSRENKWHEEE